MTKHEKSQLLATLTFVVFLAAFFVALVYSGIVIFNDAEHRIKSADACKLKCHPAEYKIASDECWCLPEGMPARKVSIDVGHD